MDRTRTIAGLIGWVALCLGAGRLAASFTAPAIGAWYAELNKPSWTPPNWVFAPVWSLLYVAMAVAAWMVWQERGLRGGALPLGLFGLQLLLNVAWSVVFFGLRRPGAALAEIAGLWLAVVATAIAFGRVAPAAGYLMVPYAGWLTFAAAVNAVIWRMNP